MNTGRNQNSIGWTTLIALASFAFAVYGAYAQIQKDNSDDVKALRAEGAKRDGDIRLLEYRIAALEKSGK